MKTNIPLKIKNILWRFKAEKTIKITESRVPILNSEAASGEHLCRSVISIKLQSSFIEITLRHKCSTVKLLHIFRTSFFKNTSGWLLLLIIYKNWHLLAINAQQSSSGLLPKHWFKFSYFPWFLGQNYKTLSFPLWFSWVRDDKFAQRILIRSPANNVTKL